jgi:hypothetical protein
MSSAARKLDFEAPAPGGDLVGPAFLCAPIDAPETGEEAPMSAEPSPEPFEYFAQPTPEMLAAEAAVGAAYEEGRALYGDEDGDAWIAALEDGTHPLCRVKTAA